MKKRGNQSVTRFIQEPERKMAEESARIMAIIAARLAISESDPSALTRKSAAVLLRSTAEQLQRAHEFERPLPPWPEAAPPAVEWEDFATGRKK